MPRVPRMPHSSRSRMHHAFDAGGINIPYPQQVVHHVHENEPAA